jgi:hypothetical protein
MIRPLGRLEKDATTPMCGRFVKRTVIAAALAALTFACASAPPPTARDLADANDTGGTLAARGDNERKLLGELGKLPSGTPQRVGDASVVAEEPYVAASGRTCRALSITTSRAALHRLACGDGKTWFFVPDVFGQQNSVSTE